MSVSFCLDLPWSTVLGECEFCDGTGVDFNAPMEFSPRPRWATPFNHGRDAGIYYSPAAPIDPQHRCTACDGLGLREERVPAVEPLNFSNRNAAVVQQALGLPVECDGSIPAEMVPVVLERCLRPVDMADIQDLEIEPSYHPGGHITKIVDVDGIPTIQTFGPQVFSSGLSASDIMWRAGAVVGLLKAAAERGCGVYWG